MRVIFKKCQHNSVCIRIFKLACRRQYCAALLHISLMWNIGHTLKATFSSSLLKHTPIRWNNKLWTHKWGHAKSFLNFIYTSPNFEAVMLVFWVESINQCSESNPNCNRDMKWWNGLLTTSSHHVGLKWSDCQYANIHSCNICPSLKCSHHTKNYIVIQDSDLSIETSIPLLL